MDDHQPRRLHWLGALSESIQQLPLLAILIVPVVLRGSMEPGQIARDALIILTALALGFRGVINWWRFRYWTEDGEFRVIQGAVLRKRLAIPFKNIRTIEMNDDVVRRLFGVVRLGIKTYAAGTQADLTAVSIAEAERIKSLLAEYVGRGKEEEEPTESELATWQTSPKDLVMAGATSGELSIVLIFAAWFLDLTAASILTPLVEWATGLATMDVLSAETLVYGAVAVVLGLGVSFLGSIGLSVVRYGNFKVSRSSDTLTIHHGLLKRQTVVLKFERIQAIRYIQNPVREILGGGALYIEAIGHSEKKGASSELAPWIRRDKVNDFLLQFLPELAGDLVIEHPPKRALFRFIFVPTLIALLIALPLVWFLQPWGIGALLLIPLIMMFRWLAWRQNGVGVSSDLVQVESRSLFSRTSARLPRRAVTAVSAKANFFQSRRELADLSFQVASGAGGKSLAAQNIEQETADGLLDWRPGRPRKRA